MLERRFGHILTTSSVAGDVPTGGLSVYAATKGGVTAFSEALRREVASQGIRVTHLVPGFIESEMTARNTFPMPPASAVGNLVVNLLKHPRRRAVIPRYYGAGIWANRLLPWIVDPVIMRLQRMFEKE
jgi:short-subunit dehydrogenase